MEPRERIERISRGINARLLIYSNPTVGENLPPKNYPRKPLARDFNVGAAQPLVSHAPLPAFERLLSSPCRHHASSDLFFSLTRA